MANPLRWTLLLLAATVAASVPGCQPPTQVTAVLTTNVGCDRLRGTAIYVGSQDTIDKTPPSTVTDACTNGRIGSIVFTPGGEKDGHLVIKVVSGAGVLIEDCQENPSLKLDADTGCIVARRSLSFVPQTPLTLPIMMRKACIGVVCLPTETCVEGGICVSSEIADPNQCGLPGGCDESGLDGMGAGGAGPGSSATGTGGMTSASGTGGFGGITSASGMAGMSSTGIGGMMSVSSSAISSSSATGTGGTGGTMSVSSSSIASGSGGFGGGASGPVSSSSIASGSGGFGGGGSGPVSSSSGVGGGPDAGMMDATVMLDAT